MIEQDEKTKTVIVEKPADTPAEKPQSDIGREVFAGYCWLCGEEKRYRIAEGYKLVPLSHLTCHPKAPHD